MLWIKDCGAHFNHFRIVKRRIEEDQINNGGNGLDWRGLTGSQSLELDHWIQIIMWIG